MIYGRYRGCFPFQGRICSANSSFCTGSLFSDPREREKREKEVKPAYRKEREREKERVKLRRGREKNPLGGKVRKAIFPIVQL